MNNIVHYLADHLLKSGIRKDQVPSIQKLYILPDPPTTDPMQTSYLPYIREV